MLEEQRSPNSYGKVFPVPPCATLCSLWFKLFLLVIESVSLPLIHHGQQRPPSEIALKIFGEQRIMPLP
jgi:hypothetical protein